MKYERFGSESSCTEDDAAKMRNRTQDVRHARTEEKDRGFLPEEVAGTRSLTGTRGSWLAEVTSSNYEEGERVESKQDSVSGLRLWDCF